MMLKNLALFLGAALLWLIMICPFADAKVSYSGRHVFLIYETLDGVMGTYLFLVNNDSEAPEKTSLPVMLDFEAMNGIGPDELKLGEGEQGGLVLDKEFKPGDSLMSVGFKVPAAMGRAVLSLSPVIDLKSLSIFVKSNTIAVSSKAGGFEKKANVTFGGSVYDTFTKNGLSAGSVEEIWVDGIPEGRGQYWMMGWIAGGLMLALTGFFAYRTRPQLGA